jgi:predicted amidohydrolase
VTLRIALAQYSLVENVDVNLTKALDWARRAYEQRAQMIVYPELCLSPFFPSQPGKDMTRYAMTLTDRESRDFQEVAKKHALVVSPNFYLREEGKLFDASLMIDSDGSLEGVSKMVHIAQCENFYEQDYYTPSDTGFHVYETAVGRIGIVVCFDRHYPESIRTCAARGAQLVIIPTANTTGEPQDVFEWELRIAAMHSGLYIAMCNRVGAEGRVVFCGDSIVIGPDGNIVARAGAAEELLCANLDFSKISEARAQRPYLQLRRPEHYA